MINEEKLTDILLDYNKTKEFIADIADCKDDIEYINSKELKILKARLEVSIKWMECSLKTIKNRLKEAGDK